VKLLHWDRARGPGCAGCGKHGSVAGDSGARAPRSRRIGCVRWRPRRARARCTSWRPLTCVVLAPTSAGRRWRTLSQPLPSGATSPALPNEHPVAVLQAAVGADDRGQRGPRRPPDASSV